MACPLINEPPESTSTTPALFITQHFDNSGVWKKLVWFVENGQPDVKHWFQIDNDKNNWIQHGHSRENLCESVKAPDKTGERNLTSTLTDALQYSPVTPTFPFTVQWSVMMTSVAFWETEAITRMMSYWRHQCRVRAGKEPGGERPGVFLSPLLKFGPVFCRMSPAGVEVQHTSDATAVRPFSPLTAHGRLHGQSKANKNGN